MFSPLIIIIITIIIVRTRFGSQPKRFRQWPNEPKTINLLESRLVIERSMSQNVDHNILVAVRMNKTNSLKMKNTSWSSPRQVCSYIFLLDLYKYSSSWLHSDFFSSFSFFFSSVMEFFPFIFPSPLSSQPSTCKSDC